jgi:ribosome-associated protein
MAVEGASDAISRRLPRLSETLARKVADWMLERKALDVVVIDVRKLSSYTDFLVIASGTSDRHVQGVAEHVVSSLKVEKTSILGAEGLSEGQWALVDVGSVVAHVFHQYTRQYYDLDGLWADAPRLALAPVVVAPVAVAQTRSR